MKISGLTFRYTEAETRLLPRLRGRVFHVTCWRNVPQIRENGEISVNRDCALRTGFGSSLNSFFRLRDCVSVFDYRNITDEQLDQSLRKCAPYQAGHSCNFELAIFFLSRSTFDRLEPWTLWKTAKPNGELGIPGVVPYAEAGHPGPIQLKSIDELLRVKMNYAPSRLELAHRAAGESDG